MPTKKTAHKTYTVNEAAKKLGVTRAAIHAAIRKGRLEFDWGETIQIIKKKARLIPAKALSDYEVDLSRQERGKKT